MSNIIRTSLTPSAYPLASFSIIPLLSPFTKAPNPAFIPPVGTSLRIALSPRTQPLPRATRAHLQALSFVVFVLFIHFPTTCWGDHVHHLWEIRDWWQPFNEIAVVHLAHPPPPVLLVGRRYFDKPLSLQNMYCRSSCVWAAITIYRNVPHRGIALFLTPRSANQIAIHRKLYRCKPIPKNRIAKFEKLLCWEPADFHLASLSLPQYLHVIPALFTPQYHPNS